jgi:hypothetical protein
MHLQLTAAAKAGISERSGRRIDRDPTLCSPNWPLMTMQKRTPDNIPRLGKLK